MISILSIDTCEEACLDFDANNVPAILHAITFYFTFLSIIGTKL